MFSNRLGILCLVLCIGSTSFAVDSANLILRIWGSDKKVLNARILAAAKAVGPEGKLILDYTSSDRTVENVRGGDKLETDVKELLNSLPIKLRSRIFLSNSDETYDWPRDTAYGWRTTPDGKSQLVGRTWGNLMTTPDAKKETSYAALGIATLLLGCEGSNIALPNLNDSPLQGGELVENGQGVCITNVEVEKFTTSAKEPNLLSETMGCNEVIYGTSIDDFKRLGHANGHTDVSAAFVGPHTVMIPSVEARCDSPFKDQWLKLKTTLKEKNLEVIEVPVGGGCTGEYKGSDGKVRGQFVRSYSNIVVLKDAILIPEFVGDTPSETKKLEFYNNQAKSILQNMMNIGRIPKRKIFGAPIPQNLANAGAEIRCMSHELPGQLKQCSQEHLDQTIEKKIKEDSDLADSLATGVSSNLCLKGRDDLKVIKFLIDEPSRNRTLTTNDGATIRVKADTRDQLSSISKKLERSLISCNSPSGKASEATK